MGWRLAPTVTSTGCAVRRTWLARPGGRHSDQALLAHIRAIHARSRGLRLARGIRVSKNRVHAAARYPSQDQAQAGGDDSQQTQSAGGAESGAAALYTEAPNHLWG